MLFVEKRLKFFAIYSNPRAKTLGDAWKAVPEGFSWFAFFLPLFWAIYHRLWALTVLVLVYYAAIGLTFGDSPVAAILQLGLHLFIGLSAADIEDFSLRRRGFEFEGVVAAPTHDRGLQRFLDQKAAV